jgi:hypothetical protein
MQALLDGKTLQSTAGTSVIKMNQDTGNIIFLNKEYKNQVLEHISAYGYFRIKQDAVEINGIEVPAPYKGKMNEGDVYYVASMLDGNIPKYQWKGFGAEQMWMDYGVIHLKEENAVAHRAALLAPTQTRGGQVAS